MTPSGGEKPYRVYRGGRVKGKVPLIRGEARGAKGGRDGQPPDRDRPRGVPPPRPKRRNWGRRIGVTLTLMLLLAIVWAVASYLAFRTGAEAAQARLDRPTKAVLTPQSGSLLSKATNILLLGTDHAKTVDRLGNRHSDSMLLLRTDPDHNRIAYLSILRDLRVSVPGYGENKINAAYQFGGPSLAARTVRSVTGLPVNHVIIVDFASFRALIDELGGIDVDVPRTVLSNRFDCPFATEARCSRWRGWRFAKGRQHLDGRSALMYSRIRKNQLDPGESDATRTARQQQVLQAIASKLTSPLTLARMPFIGEELLRPITTDLSARQFLALGWTKFRAARTLNCRLGGTSYGGYILADEIESRAVIQMIQGRSAPQPPPPNSPYGSGCLAGGRAPGLG